MSAYTWLGCDLVTGRIIDELPLTSSSLPTLIGAYSSASASLALPDAPPDWIAATEPGRALLVCVRNEDGAIVWGGFVTSRTGGSDTSVDLSLASPEAYLDRRFVTAAEYAETDEATIAAALIGMTVDEGIGLTVDAPPTGTLRDRVYDETQDLTVYSQLTELSGIEGGLEWTIRLGWNAARTAITKTAVIRPRLGRSLAMPNAVFDFPGNVKSYELVEDFGSGAGGNHVTVYGDGEGDSRPASAPARDEVLLAAGLPRFEVRESLSAVTDEATLDAHARELLELSRLGARALTLSADAASAPQYRADWDLGDDVALAISRSYRHPSGLHLIGRVIGLELDPMPGGSVAPIIHLKE